MKKLIMTVAVLATASIVTAQTVTSANVVGYTKVACPVGLSIAAIGFEGGKSVDELLGAMTSTGAAATSDTVLLWDGSVYRSYWWCDGSGYGPDYDGHWLDPNTWAQATEVVPPGTALWVSNKQGASQDLLIAGEVSLSDSNSVALPVGLTMVGNPYPTDLVIGTKGTDPSVDPSYSELAENAYSSGAVATSDTILFWNGSAYESYWYCDGTGYGPDYDGQWLDPNTWAKFDTKAIPIGSGFWYSRKALTGGVWHKTKNF